MLIVKLSAIIKETSFSEITSKCKWYLPFVYKKVDIWWLRNENEPNFFSTDAIVRKLKEVSAIENNSTKYLSKYILAVLAQFLVCQTFDTMVEFGK